MAKAEIQMPEELMASLEALGDKTDGIIQAALEAGAEVVVLRVRGNLASVIGRNLKERRRSTGALLAALGVSPVKIDSANHGAVAVLTPSSPPSSNTANRASRPSRSCGPRARRRARPVSRPCSRSSRRR